MKAKLKPSAKGAGLEQENARLREALENIQHIAESAGRNDPAAFAVLDVFEELGESALTPPPVDHGQARAREKLAEARAERDEWKMQAELAAAGVMEAQAGLVELSQARAAQAQAEREARELRRVGDDLAVKARDLSDASVSSNPEVWNTALERVFVAVSAWSVAASPAPAICTACRDDDHGDCSRAFEGGGPCSCSCCGTIASPAHGEGKR
jgi:hypothetical protein